MNKSLIFICEKSQLIQALNLEKKLSFEGKKTSLLTKRNFANNGKTYPVRDFKFYERTAKFNFHDMRKEAYGLFMSLGQKKISDKATLKKMTEYKGVSLWDMSVDYITPRLQSVLYEFNMLAYILTVEMPSQVIVINNEAGSEKLIELLCAQKNIPFSVHNKEEPKKQNIGGLSKKAVLLLKRIKRFSKSLFYLSLNTIKFRQKSKKYKVVFFPSVERYLCSVLPVIHKYNADERLVVSTFSCSSNKLKECGIDYRELWGYRLYDVFNKPVQNLLKEIYGLVSSDDFLSKIVYRNVLIGCMLNEIFEELIFEIFYHNVQKINIISNVLEQHKPETVVVIHYCVDVSLVAHSMSIPIVAMQSCSIYEFCFFGPLIHDAVIVDGNYWKEYLLQNNDIDFNKIHVTGPVKFEYTKLENKNLLNLPRTKKIVTFAANNSYLDMGIIDYEKIRDIEAICRAIRNIKETHLVVKAHPYEKNLNLYETIAREAGLSDYSIIHNGDMMELLNSSDLLIALNSTASYDAVLLNKNVISLCGVSTFEPEDMWNFKEYNAAIILDNPEDLEKCIRKSLFDPDTIAGLKKGRELYIAAHAHKLDNKASCRAKKVIDSFIEIGLPNQ